MNKQKLSQITISITDGKHGDCDKCDNSGYYFVGAKEINNNRIDYRNAKQITKSSFIESHKRTKLEPNDICIVNTGATIGKSAFVFEDYPTNNITFQKSVAIIKPNINLIDPYYLFLLLQYHSTNLLYSGTGSAQKNLLLSDMRNLEFDIVLKSRQHHIMDIIGSIDKKIECNNLIISTIQNIICLIYNQSVINGENAIKLKNIIKKDKIPFKYTNIVKTLDLSNINSNSINLSTYSLSSEFKTNLFEIKKGTLFYGSIRPYLHKSGICPFNGAVAGTVHSFSADTKYLLLTLAIITSEAFHNYAVSNSQGTKMPVINYEVLENYEILINNKYEEYNKKCFNIIDKLISAMNENYKLKEYKKTLLPLLLNEQVL